MNTKSRHTRSCWTTEEDKRMKKWIAAILTLVMLSQALPWTAFAATGDMITDAEL